MKIKFDRIIAKTAKCCALICTVLFVIGVVFSFLEIDGTEFFYIMTIYASVLVGVPCYVVLLSAKFYFIRLRAYGYEIPENKKTYGNNLNNLPKRQEDRFLQSTAGLECGCISHSLSCFWWWM